LNLWLNQERLTRQPDRAAAVINEPIAIAPHLSLPPFDIRQ
jgi:hypothetical protein